MVTIPSKKWQTSQHNEDTPCASWLPDSHSSAFSPVYVRVPRLPTGSY